MKINSMESKWERIGWVPTKENFRGYVLSHFEMIYLGVRNMACVNINIFDGDEGLKFIDLCCDEYDCRVFHVNEGEVWICKNGGYYWKGEIPSRFSKNPKDHLHRGQILGYSEQALESYFEDGDDI